MNFGCEKRLSHSIYNLAEKAPGTVNSKRGISSKGEGCKKVFEKGSRIPAIKDFPIDHMRMGGKITPYRDGTTR